MRLAIQLTAFVVLLAKRFSMYSLSVSIAMTALLLTLSTDWGLIDSWPIQSGRSPGCDGGSGGSASAPQVQLGGTLPCAKAAGSPRWYRGKDPPVCRVSSLTPSSDIDKACNAALSGSTDTTMRLAPSESSPQKKSQRERGTSRIPSGTIFTIFASEA